MWYSWVVFFHVLAGAFFAANLIVMQVAVTGVLQSIPPGPGKKKADDFLEKNWRPVPGYVVPVIWITAGILFYYRMDLFFSHPLYMAKGVTGLYTLTAVSLNHFYFRHVNRRLRFSENPEDRAKFESMKKWSHILERSILFGAATTVVLAVLAHHVPGLIS